MSEDALARALAKADGKVYWTPDIPAAYRYQAAALVADGWRVIPPGQKFSQEFIDHITRQRHD